MSDKTEKTTMGPIPNGPEVFLEGSCRAITPDTHTGCKLIAGHSGPHQNAWQQIEWENLGTGQCHTRLFGYQCLKEQGHSGFHQNGENIWN